MLKPNSEQMAIAPVSFSLSLQLGPVLLLEIVEHGIKFTQGWQLATPMSALIHRDLNREDTHVFRMNNGRVSPPFVAVFAPVRKVIIQLQLELSWLCNLGLALWQLHSFGRNADHL